MQNDHRMYRMMFTQPKQTRICNSGILVHKYISTFIFIVNGKSYCVINHTDKSVGGGEIRGLFSRKVWGVRGGIKAAMLVFFPRPAIYWRSNIDKNNEDYRMAA